MAFDDVKRNKSANYAGDRIDAEEHNAFVSAFKSLVSSFNSHAHDAVYAAIDHVHSIYVETTDSRLSDTRTPKTHSHAQSDVTNLATTLSSKSNTDHTHNGYVSDGDSRLTDARTPVTHSHAQSDVTNLGTALSGKSDLGHVHDLLYAALNHLHDSVYAALDHAHDSIYAAIGHTHDYTGEFESKNSNIQTHISSTDNPHGVTASQTGAAEEEHTHSEYVETTDSRLSDTRDPNAHSHTQSDVTNLTTALSNKSDSGHSHDFTGVFEAKNSNIQTHITSAHAPANAQKNSDITKAEIEAKLTETISSHSHSVSKSDVGLSNVTNDAQIPLTQKGAVSGVAELDETGKVPSSQLPTSSGLSLGETETTAYRGDRGKTAYDHSQSVHAPSTAEANVNADWNASSGDAQILNKPALGGAALLNVGTGSGTVAAGDDSRLSDSRTPTSHAHGNLTNDGKIGITSGLPIITSTDGALVPSSFGTSSNTFCQGNDSRLSNSRTPTSHASSHVTGGSDVISNVVAAGNAGLMTGADKTKLDGIAAGAEVNIQSDWNATSGDALILNKPTIPSAYTLPVATSSVLGGVKQGDNITIAADGTISGAAGGGSGGMIPYSAMVYKSGSTIYAITASGTAITSGSDASTVIQAALYYLNPANYTEDTDLVMDHGGSLYIAAGDYTLTSPVIIYQFCHVFLNQFTRILATTNIDLFIMKRGSQIDGNGGTIWIPPNNGWASNAITVDVTDAFSLPYAGQIRNLCFYSWEWAGTAIYYKMDGDESTLGAMNGFVTENIKIFYFEYGIRIYRRATTSEGNWMNNNYWNNIFTKWTNWAWHQSSNIETGASSGGVNFEMNSINNFYIQPHTSHAHAVMRIYAYTNHFHNLTICDWPTSGYAYAIYLCTNSAKNTFSMLNNVRVDNMFEEQTAGIYAQNTAFNVCLPYDVPRVFPQLNAVYRGYTDNCTSLEELAVCSALMGEPLRWISPTATQSSDGGTTFTASTYASATQLALLMVGGGQKLSSVNRIEFLPHATTSTKVKYRLTWGTYGSGTYYMLNKLYLNLDCRSNYINVTIEKATSGSAWSVVYTSTNFVENNAYVYIPHTEIYAEAVRITFTLVNPAANTNTPRLYSLDWYGRLAIGNKSPIEFDGSKGAIFPGVLKPVQAATASAPAYVKGAVYFDTTLNKLRIGGASAWETITSS